MIGNGAVLSARPEGNRAEADRFDAVEGPPSSAPAAGGSEAPLFRVPPDSIAERLADRFADLHPVLAGATALAIGYAALVAATIAAGVLLVEVVLAGSVLNWDNDVIDWLAERRTPLGNDVSSVGSYLSETVTVLAIVAVVALILCLHRRFVATLFFVTAIAVEAAAYLATTLVIDRPRPPVVRLENLDPGASYPSGHTAASVVIYVGIAMLVLAYAKNRAARVAAVVIAVIAPLAVALARMYRGMHHPIDVISGALIGVGCLCVGLLVARVFNAVDEGRRCEEAKS